MIEELASADSVNIARPTIEESSVTAKEEIGVASPSLAYIGAVIVISVRLSGFPCISENIRPKL